MRYIFSIALVCAVFVSGEMTGSAEAITADEIVSKANLVSYYEGNDGRARITMTVKTRGGTVREKAFVVLRFNQDKGGNQKFYVYYEKPDDIRGTVYMVWKKIEGDDDRWLYLPGLNLVTRVAASDKRSRFAGSDFVYEDISGRNITEDAHELIGETDAVYRLKSVPKDPGSVEFAYYVTEIDKETFLPMKIEYFNDRNETIRIVETVEVKTIDGHPTATQARARDLRSGGETLLHFTDVAYDVGLSENIFTERYLQRPPRKWLR